MPHPNAPVGGGGPGTFAHCGPLGCNPLTSSGSPHHQAPAQIILGQSGAVVVQANSGSSAAGSPSPDLNESVRSAAEALVGRPVVGRGECYDLADHVLRSSGAHSAPHYGRITDDADYRWGTPVTLDQIRPGDILQFRNHRIRAVTVTLRRTTAPDGSWTEQTETQTQDRVRPHHTAVVLSVQDGNVIVAEQNVPDAVTGQIARDVRQNTFPVRSQPPQQRRRQFSQSTPVAGTRVDETVTVTVTVSGDLWAYRPQPTGQTSTPPGQPRSRSPQPGRAGARR